MVELRDSESDNAAVVDTVLINGSEVLVSGDHPIQIHDIEDGSPVLITLTLIAGRVVIGGQL